MERSRAFPMSLRQLRNGFRIIVLLTAAACSASCLMFLPDPPLCREIREAPRQLDLVLSRPASDDVVYVTGFALYEGGGLELRQVPWLYRCTRLPNDRAEAWLGLATSLNSTLPVEKPAYAGEQVGIILPDQSRRYQATSELDTRSLEALQALCCLAVEAIGKHADRAIRAAIPELAARLDLPASCEAPPP